MNGWLIATIVLVALFILYASFKSRDSSSCSSQSGDDGLIEVFADLAEEIVDSFDGDSGGCGDD